MWSPRSFHLGSKPTVTLALNHSPGDTGETLLDKERLGPVRLEVTDRCWRENPAVLFPTQQLGCRDNFETWPCGQLCLQTRFPLIWVIPIPSSSQELKNKKGPKGSLNGSNSAVLVQWLRNCLSWKRMSKKVSHPVLIPLGHPVPRVAPRDTFRQLKTSVFLRSFSR